MKASRLAVLGAALIAACAGDGRTVVTVYSPHGRNLLEYYEQQFEQAHPEIDVQWVDMGSQQVLERLRAERANPQADVWFGAPAEIFARAAQEGLLESYRPTWADLVSADARGADDMWYGTYLTPEVIAYNSDAVDSASAPQDWDDVLDPKWDQKILIRDPVASGSMRAIWAAILIRSIEQTGNTEAGWRWLRTLDARTREYTLDGAFLTQKLGRQEGLITLFNMPDVVLMQQRDSVAVKFIIPRSGTPLLVDAIALVRGSDVPDAARLYYEFVTSREAIETAMQRFTRIPARNDLDASTHPDWLRNVYPLLTPMRLDSRLLADSLDTWMTYWDANVRNRGTAP